MPGAIDWRVPITFVRDWEITGRTLAVSIPYRVSRRTGAHVDIASSPMVHVDQCRGERERERA